MTKLQQALKDAGAETRSKIFGEIIDQIASSDRNLDVVINGVCVYRWMLPQDCTREALTSIVGDVARDLLCDSESYAAASLEGRSNPITMATGWIRRKQP